MNYTEAKETINHDAFYRVDEVCKMLGISKRTLQTWRDERVITFIQVKGKIYFQGSDIYTFLVINKIQTL